MNKAQDIFEKVKRHQFWILCGLVSIVGIVSWWLATRSLADTYTKNKQKIDSEASKIASVRGVEPHPNDSWNEKVGSQVETEKKAVAKAWDRLYAEQKSKVYVWPASWLGDEFVAEVQRLEPGKELSSQMLNIYLNEGWKQFRDLAKVVDAEYLDPTETTAGPERLSAPATLSQTEHKVAWNGLVELQQPYIWSERPSTQQVLFAQEEFWVMKALCEAIAKANEDASGSHDAAVRTIEELLVGYLAAEEYPNGMKEPGRVTRVKAPLATGGGYGAVASDAAPDAAAGASSEGGAAAVSGGGALPRPPRPDMTASGRGGGGYGSIVGETAAAATTSTNPDDYLKEWRYVNADSKPLGAAELANPPFYEYRLMPWRLRMTVDPRKWDELLVTFRNADLPLAIRQVRVNPMDGSGGSMMGGGGREGGRGGGGYGGVSRESRGGYGGVSRESRGGYGGVSRESRGGYGGAGRGAVSPFATGTLGAEQTLMLELRGVAYLINVPDHSKIGVVGAGGSVAATAPAGPASEPTGSDPFAAPPAAPAPPPAARPGAGYGSGR